MVTKSKNYKNIFAVKFISVLLAVLSVLSGCICAVYCFVYADFYDMDTKNFGVYKSYTDTPAFQNRVRSDVDILESLMHCEARNREIAKIRAGKDAAVTAETQRFLTEKAAVVANEIYYVATHYEQKEDDYYEQAYREQFEHSDALQTTTLTLPAENQTTGTTQPPQTAQTAEDTLASVPNRKVEVDDHAPCNVRYCQMLVNTTEGLDWLQYVSLVRDEAFSEQDFVTSFSMYTDFNLGSEHFSYRNSEQQISAELEAFYDNIVENIQGDLEVNRSIWESRLGSLVNFRYYAVSQDGKTYSNLQKQASAESIQAEPMWVSIGSNGVISGSQTHPALMNALDSGKYNNALGSKEVMYIGMSFPFQSGDEYSRAEYIFTHVIARYSPVFVLSLAALSLLVLLACTILLLALCGHAQGTDEITLCLADKIPTDIHLLLSAAACTGILAVMFVVFNRWDTYNSDEYVLGIAVLLVVALCTVLVWLVGMEWLTSVLRIKKAGQSYFRKFVLWKLLRFVWRIVRNVWRIIKKGIHFLLDQPKQIRYVFVIACFVYMLITMGFLLIGYNMDEWSVPAVGIPILTLLFLLVQVYFLRILDRIIDASCDKTKFPIPGIERMPRALRLLADNLTITNRDLDRAVAEAVRNERTKAELITNVSHDLKTPLTSIISYVDLLKKCDIQDPKAVEYLGTLTEKSEKLKRLVEDLIEASKVSAGNVALHPLPLNLAELAMQAVVEFTPSLEQQSLEVKFAQPEIAPIIHADSTKTYRILENLLSNVRKYAAPHSRVYARVGEQGAFGIFEIKNISHMPLNVEPQELMERFVRGDVSRSEEGNGLGLSIAQQLCTLQGGRLEIQIDGDLFKAIVLLPLESAGT